MAIFLALLVVCLTFSPSLQGWEVGGSGNNEGKTYTSPRRDFTVVVPSPEAFWTSEYQITRESKKGAYEVMQFRIKDSGELYRVGIYDAADALTVAEGVAANFYKQSYQVSPQVIQQTKISTQFGEGLLRVYFAKDGALIEELRGDGGKLARTRPDTRFALLAVQHDQEVVLALAFDDMSCVPSDKSVAACQQLLENKVEALVSSMKLTR